jgi:hypothetical protein
MVTGPDGPAAAPADARRTEIALGQGSAQRGDVPTLCRVEAERLGRPVVLHGILLHLGWGGRDTPPPGAARPPHVDGQRSPRRQRHAAQHIDVRQCQQLTTHGRNWLLKG